MGLLLDGEDQVNFIHGPCSDSLVALKNCRGSLYVGIPFAAYVTSCACSLFHSYGFSVMIFVSIVIKLILVSNLIRQGIKVVIVGPLLVLLMYCLTPVLPFHSLHFPADG